MARSAKGREFFKGKEMWSSGFFVRKPLFGMGLLMLSKQGPRLGENFTADALEGCACVQKMPFQAPEIYQSHSPRRLYLRSRSHFCFQEGKWFFVLEEERITEVFILPTAIFIICFISFLKGA